MPEQTHPLTWTEDRPSDVGGSGRGVPGARASVEDDYAPGAVGDVTTMALCGLVFASVAAGGRPRPRQQEGPDVTVPGTPAAL